jgi:hypothetical protein
MLLKAPFRLPPDFLTRFGYHGGRRFIALFWEPAGDEACYDDGESYACGLSNNWLYLDFVHQSDVRAWLDENGLCLGNSDEAARHWLIADARTADLHAAPWKQAAAMVRRQELETGE